MNVESQGTEQVKLFSQGTSDAQNLRYETLAAANYEYVKISSFAMLDMKFWMNEDDDLHTNHI